MNPENRQDPLDQLNKSALKKALQNFSRANPIDGALTSFLLYRQFKDKGISDRGAAVALFGVVLEELRKNDIVDVIIAQAIESYYLENLTGDEVAVILRGIEGNPFTVADGAGVLHLIESQAIKRLRAIINYLEEKARDSRYNKLIALSMVSRSQIEPVGLDAHLDKLFALINETTQPWFINIHGPSGIGKTTLIYKIMQYTSKHDFTWPEILWLSLPPHSSLTTPPQKISINKDVIGKLIQLIEEDSGDISRYSHKQALLALRTQFKRRHIVVIDNLKTDSDIKAILPDLRRLNDPTKFVLLSQEAIYDELDVRNYEVGELSVDNSLRLLKKMRTLHSLDIEHEHLAYIVECVGGNPQALLKVTAQILSGVENPIEGLARGDLDI